jgi:hypothetical protein
MSGTHAIDFLRFRRDGSGNTSSNSDARSVTASQADEWPGGQPAGRTGPARMERCSIHDGGHGMNVSDPLPSTTERPQLSTLKPKRSAMSLYAKDRHKRACRMLVYALTADDPVIWVQTAWLLGHRLPTMELASLAYAVMRALDPEAREMVFNAAQWGAV